MKKTIRTNYFSMPSDYILELQQKGKRLKARCFMEYMVDMHAGEVNSISFYCQSWGIKSKGSVHKWIGEFVREFERYNNFWSLKNTQHHSNVKFESERKVNGKENFNTSESTSHTDFEENTKNKSERQVNEVFNINTSNRDSHLFDKKFKDIEFIYNMNYGFRSDPVEAYKYFKDIGVDIDLLKIAVMTYLHDNDVPKKYKMINFFKKQIYLNYMPKKIKVLIDDDWHYGVYDDKTEQFITDEGTRTLTTTRLLELYRAGKLEYINPHQEKIA